MPFAANQALFTYSAYTLRDLYPELDKLIITATLCSAAVHAYVRHC